jgi:ribonuclease HI
VTAEIDGASRGNPGPSAWGARLVSDDGSILAEVGGFLGDSTNNVAEWSGLVGALLRAKQLGAMGLTVRSDSELLVRQATGRYRIRSVKLKPLAARVFDLVRTFEEVRFVHVSRSENCAADAIANRVLNTRSGGGPDPEEGVIL